MLYSDSGKAQPTSIPLVPLPVPPTHGAKGNGEKEKYTRAKKERQAYVDKIVNCKNSKKIVVAGPGTGKTHLFRRVLQGKKKNLTLSFVNELVSDLSLELCDASEVKTLHGFALSELKDAKAKMFPKLPLVISRDAELLRGEDIDFRPLFHDYTNLEDKRIQFYKQRREYYAHFGFEDIVYAVVKRYERNKLPIPRFDQVLIDEFQDFNLLEVALIDSLARKSPILLAGDDDQALYESLKNATARFIRQRFASADYSSFTLPYCSRSTRVIIDAFNDLVLCAQANGNLVERVPKSYRYFECEEKDKESKRHPRIPRIKLFRGQEVWFIAKQIMELAKKEKSRFSVLIIAPSRERCKGLAATLVEYGFKKVETVRDKEDGHPTLMEGFNLLLRDRFCNLGWRIVAEILISEEEFKAILNKSAEKDAEEFRNLIDKTHRNQIDEFLTILRAVRDGEELQDVQMAAYQNLLTNLNIDAAALAHSTLNSQIAPKPNKMRADSSITKIPIQLTTIQGCKGLSHDFVFITDFDDRFLLKDKKGKSVTDQEVCNVLVALTRARKAVFLISSDQRATSDCVFVRWINESRLERLELTNNEEP